MWTPTGAVITAYGGSKQSTPIGTAFPHPLQAQVVNLAGTPLPNVPVTFAVPYDPPGSASPGANFADGTVSAVAMTDANGIATSPPVIAGANFGRWGAEAFASVDGFPDATTTFVLRNERTPTGTSVTVTPESVTLNEAVTVRADVTAADGTPAEDGKVEFFVQGNKSIVDVHDGVAVLPIPAGTLAQSTSLLLAIYYDSPTLAPSSGSFPLFVEPTPMTVEIASSANPSTIGDAVTFYALATVPAGNTPCSDCQVTFSVNGNAITTVALAADGTANTAPITDLPVGENTITATVTGNSTYISSPATLDQKVGGVPYVSITASQEPSYWGQDITLAVQVNPQVNSLSPTPTGTVDVTLAPFACHITLVEGAGSCPMPGDQAAGAGYFGFVGTYSGDVNYPPTSDSTIHQFLQAPTTVTLTPSQPTVTAGKPVTFTLTVNSPFGAPSGGMYFTDNGEQIVSLDNWIYAGGTQVTPPVTISDDGVHIIKAQFIGTEENPPPDYVQSTGTAKVTIEPAATTVDIAPLNTATTAALVAVVDSASFSVRVAAPGLAGVVDGTVQFRVNGIEHGPHVTLVDGQATSPLITGLTPGSHDVQAIYTPRAGLGLAPSYGVLTHIVTRPTVTLLGSSTNPSPPANPITFVAAIGPAAGDGAVRFTIDGTLPAECADVPVRQSIAKCTISGLPPGNHTVTASYSGTANLLASSITITQVVDPPAPPGTSTLPATGETHAPQTALLAALAIVLGLSAIAIGRRNPRRHR